MTHAVAERRVALDVDVADLHLRALVDVKGHFEGRRRNLPDLGIHGRVLASALGQIFLSRTFFARWTLFGSYCVPW